LHRRRRFARAVVLGSGRAHARRLLCLSRRIALAYALAGIQRLPDLEGVALRRPHVGHAGIRIAQKHSRTHRGSTRSVRVLPSDTAFLWTLATIVTRNSSDSTPIPGVRRVFL